MWDFTFTDKGGPRYRQIADALEKDILSGELFPGHRLMTHRDLARATGVTVSTATRAYAEVEKRGLIKTMVGRGTFVTAVTPAIIHDGEMGSPIELGVVMPLALEEPCIRPVLQKIMAEEDVDALVKRYSPFGYAHHREIAARWLRRSGVDVTAESLLITAGHQHGLYSIFYTLFGPTDKIAVDLLTNPGLKLLALQAGFDLRGVRMDADGMIPEELDALCAANEIKGIYVTGGIQNPSARQVPPKRRDALAKVIERHRLIMVEDSSFFLHGNEGASAITAMLPENSIFLSSFSSTLYSGLRVAFVHAAPRFHSRLAQTIVENIWTVAPLCVALACECIANGLADRAIEQKRKEIARRVSMVRDTLAGFDVSCSEQSIYAWIRLPDSWNSRDFEYLAERSGVRVLAADKLAVAGAVAPNAIRLAVTGPPDMASLKRGLSILASLLKREGGSISPIW